MEKPRDVTDEDYSEFRKLLLDVIDESLNKILGETSTRFIYSFLERRNLKREDIPDNIEDFHFVLKKIFNVGAYVIEKVIIEKLYSRISPEDTKKCIIYESPEQFNFVNYVKTLKKLTLTPTKGPIQRHNMTTADTLIVQDSAGMQSGTKSGVTRFGKADLNFEDEKFHEELKNELRRIRQRIDKEKDSEKKAKMLKAYNEMVEALEMQED